MSTGWGRGSDKTNPLSTDDLCGSGEFLDSDNTREPMFACFSEDDVDCSFCFSFAFDQFVAKLISIKVLLFSWISSEADGGSTDLVSLAFPDDGFSIFLREEHCASLQS